MVENARPAREGRQKDEAICAAGWREKESPNANSASRQEVLRTPPFLRMRISKNKNRMSGRWITDAEKLFHEFIDTKRDSNLWHGAVVVE